MIGWITAVQTHVAELEQAVCKTVGLAYVGSNPTPATIKLAGQTRSSGPGLVRWGSGLRYRRGCLTDREGSAFGQVGAVVRLVPGESGIAAELLGVVELWLSQARPETARSRGCGATWAPLICLTWSAGRSWPRWSGCCPAASSVGCG